MELSIRYQSILLVCFVGILQNNLCTGDKFLIVHWNDIGAQVERFYPGTPIGNLPPVAPCNLEKCVGGLPNLVHYINEAYNSESMIPESNRFRLTPGNLVGGENGFLSVIGWESYGALLNDFYKPNAMSMGVKDFGAGLDRTNAYLVNATNIVLTNVDCLTNIKPGSSEQKFCTNIVSWKELAPSVGLLGFINPNVEKLGSPGTLKFGEIITSLTNEVNRHPETKTFIAIGDGSLDTSRRILETIPKVKLVIYGMGFGNSKDMQGNYPMKHGSGYIATAGSWGSTIGKLVFDTDNNGNIVNITGSSKLILTEGLKVDETEAVDVANEFSRRVETYKKPIGQTIFKLEGGERCWRKECNLGNLVTDAMVHCAITKSNMIHIGQTPVVALWHGGALFDDQVLPNASITHMDVHRWLPYHNRAHLVKIQGSQLWEVFQTSAKGITANENNDVNDWGQFLQVSNGLEVYYSVKGKDTPTLERIRILHEEDSTPVMKDLEKSMPYYVVIPSIILEGRTVYGFAKDYWQQVDNIDFDDECLRAYIEALGKISIGFEERIWIDSDLPCTNTNSVTKSGNTAVTVIVTIVIMLVLIGIAYVGYFYVVPRITGRTPNGFRNFGGRLDSEGL